MTSSTTIIFVPGAWHNPECYADVANSLEVAGYKTDFVHLPSVDPAVAHTDWAEDISAIRTKITNAVLAGQKVVVVVHSYGGIPSSEALKGLPDLSWENRQQNKQVGGVTHLVYCCSFLVPQGKSLVSAIGGKDLPWFQIDDERRLVTPATPERIFYNDMNAEEVQSAVARLRPHSYMTFHSQVTYEAWRSVPTTYVYCLKDAAIPISVQKIMVEEVAKGAPIRTETLNASHSPFYSMPRELVSVIRRAAGEDI